MAHIPANRSYHCEDCQCIGDNASQCACCQSRSIFMVSTILRRDPVAAELSAIMGTFREVMRGKVWA